MLQLLQEKIHEAFESQKFELALLRTRQAKEWVGDLPYLLVVESQCLYYMRRAHEAVALMRELVQKHPLEHEYKLHLSLYLRAVGDFDESFSLIETVPAEVPGKAFLLGWHLLRQGKFAEGMTVREREPGIRRVDSLYHYHPGKKYQKGMNLTGKRVVLALEGGNGDEVAYARFAQFLERRGASVMLGSSPEMLSILSRVPGITALGDVSQASPESYDFYIPAMSMISLFDIDNPSAQTRFPYLASIPDFKSALREELVLVCGASKKIGIQWRGNPQFDYSEFKTFPGSLLVPFARLGKLVSFQMLDQAGDNLLPDSANAYDLHRVVRPTWERTLAAIDEMDFVISGDTTIAHMAGALGKPTALLLPHAPHPYWADLRERSTWYPSVRVFRQPHYNDWEGAARSAYAWIESQI